MNEAKFTKGKWKALIKPIDEKPLSTFQDITIKAGGHDIASVYVSSDDPEWLKHREQAIHDANVMAASADMYDMLSTIKRVISSMAVCDSYLYDLVEKDIDPLLAKARGE